jgi:hypothetical protein
MWLKRNGFTLNQFRLWSQKQQGPRKGLVAEEEKMRKSVSLFLGKGISEIP